MTSYKVGQVNVRGIDALPEITAAGVTPTTDKMLVWDASAAAGDRLKAIRVSQLPELVGAIVGNVTALQYEIPFAQADLSMAGVLPVIHGLNSYPSGVTVYAPNGDEVDPDRVEVVSANAIAVHLSSFAPITGIWKLSLTS